MTSPEPDTEKTTATKAAAAGKRSGRGFRRASMLLSGQVRKAGESRGFAVARLLTHWPEIAGEEIAAIARPVEVSYGRGGFGASLSLLTTGANAPMLEMQKETLRNRVNAAYGYNAIARIRITQTHATGFAEGQADFDHGFGNHGRKRRVSAQPDAAARKGAAEAAGSVVDDGLRRALETLGQNVFMKSKSRKGSTT